MKPAWHIEHKTEGCYLSNVKNAQENKKYIRASISKEDIGKLLQDTHITLLFLNDAYGLEGMLDIGLSDDKTVFDVSEQLNHMIINT